MDIRFAEYGSDILLEYTLLLTISHNFADGEAAHQKIETPEFIYDEIRMVTTLDVYMLDHKIWMNMKKIDR